MIDFLLSIIVIMLVILFISAKSGYFLEQERKELKRRLRQN